MTRKPNETDIVTFTNRSRVLWTCIDEPIEIGPSPSPKPCGRRTLQAGSQDRCPSCRATRAISARSASPRLNTSPDSHASSGCPIETHFTRGSSDVFLSSESFGPDPARPFIGARSLTADATDRECLELQVPLPPACDCLRPPRVFEH